MGKELEVRNPSSLRAIVYLVAIGVVLACLNYLVWWTFRAELHDVSYENRLIENIQAASLFVAAILSLIISFKSKPTGYRVLFLGLGLFFLTFVIREIDFDKFETRLLLYDILDAPIRDFWLVPVWLIALGIFVRHARVTFGAFLQWLRSLKGALVCFGGFLYIVGWIFDLKVFDLIHEQHMFLEELSETNATNFIVLSMILSFQWGKTSNWWAGCHQGAMEGGRPQY